MQEKSIVKNSMYYLLYQVFNVLFPFITGMYVARVLLPTANGMVAFAFNISGYFSTLAFVGIPTYGLREISKYRNDKNKMSKVFSELVAINTISTLVCVVAYLILILSVAKFRDKLLLYCVTGLSIVFNFLNISWLFEGLEEFKYISLRNIFFKLACIVCLLLFVHSEKDYLRYALITVFGTAGNYLLNVTYARRFVKLSFKTLNLKQHLASIFALVAVNLAIELYSMVDTTMLGFFTAEDNVAYYTYAQRIYRILLQVINSFTIVIVPRLALYFKEGKQNEFNTLTSKTFETILALAIPMIVGLQFVARDAITVIYSDAFEPSSPVLRILSILLLISPIGYLLGSRMLLVANQEKRMVLCVGAGAVVNFIGNLILIPNFSEIGASIASVISEICVMTIYIIVGKKYFRLRGVRNDILKIGVGIVGMVISILIVRNITDILLLKIILESATAMLVYFVIMFALKESLVYDYAGRFLKKIGIVK